MEKYTLEDLQIQKLTNVRLWELDLKSQQTKEISKDSKF